MATATVLPDDPTKVFGRRVGAALIDGVIVLVPSVAVITSQYEYLTLDSSDEATDYCDEFIDQFDGACVSFGDQVFFNDSTADGTAFIGLGLALVMFVLLQGLTGWSIGKLLTRIRVVDENGAKPGLGKALVRWLLWIVDGLPLFGLVGFITGLTTVGHRRVGDMVAKTYVVDARAAGSPIRVPGGTTPPAPDAPGAPLVRPAPTFEASAHPQPTAKAGPQWDEQRKTYIQWDPEARLWMQWDETASAWNPIPNQ